MIARQLVPERMDSPTLPAEAHLLALKGLSRINRVSGAVRPFLKSILRLAAANRPGRPLRLLDVGCGGGDVPVALANAARRAGVAVDLTLFDQSDTALTHARQHAERHGHRVHTARGNATTHLPHDEFDVVTCSLFLHHLEADAAVAALRHMRLATGKVLLVSDLRRSAVGWAVAQVGCRVLSRSDVVHFDGPASVRGAFTIHEMTDLAHQAGLAGARVTRQWPWRLFLHWRRDV